MGFIFQNRYIEDVDITGFKVECALNDWQLGVSLIILIIFYLIGYLSGLLLFKIFSFSSHNSFVAVLLSQ
jgi:hypothetical protein